MRLKHFLSVFLTLLTLSVGQMWGANSGLTASAGTFILDFYNSEKLTSSSGTDLSYANCTTHVTIPKGVTSAGTIVTACSKTGTVQIDKMGGLTFGKSSNSDSYATFTIANDFPIRKISVVATKWANIPLYVDNQSVTANNQSTAYANCTSHDVTTNYITSLKIANKSNTGSNAGRITLYTAVCEYGYRATLTQPSEGSISAVPKTGTAQSGYENGAGWNSTLGAVVGLKSTQKVTLSASAPNNKEFDHWTVKKTASPYTDVTADVLSDNELTMPAYDVTVTVTWRDAASCTSEITITKGTPSNGSFTMTPNGGTVCIDEGNASVTISNINPSNGYRFKEITSSGGGTINNNAKTVTNISANTTINVVFEQIPSHKAFFYNGTTLLNAGGTDVQEGAAVSYSGATPTSCESGTDASTTFAGWATDTWEGKVAKNDIEPDFYESTLPVMGDKDVTYYAVFCKAGTSATPTSVEGEISTSNPYLSGTGWATSTAKTYSGPYLRLDADEQNITYTAPSNTTISRFQFKYKLMASTACSGHNNNQWWTGEIGFYGSNDGGTVWTKIDAKSISYDASCTSASDVAKDYADLSSGGYNAIKIQLNKTCGNVGIKDLSATYSATASPASNYMTTCCQPLGQINGSVSLSQTSATLTWELQDAQNGGTDHINSWKVEYKEDGAANWMESESALAKATLTKTISNLNCNTNYQFRVSANVADGYCCDAFETSGTTTKFAITKNLATEGGWQTLTTKIGANEVSEACDGATILVAATPDGSHEGAATIVIRKTSDNSDVTTAVGYSNGSFTMPAYAVKVCATFAVKQDPSITVKNNVTSLTFGPVADNVSCDAQTFTISGLNLEAGKLTVASNSNKFVISSTALDENGQMDVNGALGETVITVTPVTNVAGVFNGKVTISGGGLENAVEITLSLTVLQTYTAKWFVNGAEQLGSTVTGIAGTALTFPANPSATGDCEGLTFQGWKVGAIDGTAASEPSYVNPENATMPVNGVNYYAVFAEGSSGDETESVTWSTIYDEQTDVEGQELAIGAGTKVTFNKGTNSNKCQYYTTGGAIRVYGGGNFVVSAPGTITSITLTFGTGDNNNTISANVGTYSDGSWEGEANSVTFSIGGTTNHRRIAGISVTYSASSLSGWVTTCPQCSKVTLQKVIAGEGAEEAGNAIAFSPASTTVKTCEAAEVTVSPTIATGWELTSVVPTGVPGVTYDAGVISIPANATGELTVTATFAQKNYSITMEQRGGANATLSDNQTNKHYNDLIEISTTEPEGYEFGGWFIYDATDTEKENDLYESIFTGDYEEDYNKLTANFYMPERNLVALAHFDKIYSVSEFAALSKTDGTKYLVEGIVSSVQGYYSKKYITYFLSVDGKNENTLKIYNGLDEGGEDFSAISDLKVGDKVRVYGAWNESNSRIDDSYLTLHTVGEHASYEIAGDLTQDVFVEGATFLDSYMANLKVNDVYNTGYKVEVDDVTFSANKTTLATTDEVVRVTATKNASTLAEKDFTISVSAATMVSFELKEGYKTSYFVGQTFVKPTVVATLSDNSQVEAEATACTGYNMSAADTYDVTVSFTYGTTTLNNVQYQITVRTIANDLATAYTASEAKDIIENVYASTTESDYDVYVSGIAVSDPNNEGTYFISNDGSASNQVQIYKGKYFDSSVSAKDNVKAGDELVVKGHILVYSNAAEMKSTTVVSQVREGELDVDDVEEFEVGSDDLVAANLTINRHGSNGAITFSCDENSALEIVENGTKLRAKGTEIANVEVSATMAEVTTTGVINFTEATTTFNVHVVPVQTKYTISFDSNDADGGAAPTPIADKAAGANVTLPDNSWTKTGYNFDGWKVTYVDGDEVVHEVTITANAFIMPAYNVTIQAQWAEISEWATVYTSNVTMSGATSSTVVIGGNEFPAMKAGTGNAAGSVNVTVPAHATTIHFHASGWDEREVTLNITAPTGITVTPASVNLIADAGASGNENTYTLQNDPATQAYFSVSLSGNTDEFTLNFANTGSKKQFILFGVNQVGGVVPVLDHIVVSGELTYKDYELGDNLNTAGLTVTAYYTLAGEPHHNVDVTEDVAWSYDPLTGGQTSVDVTATYEGKTNTKACAINAVVVPEPEIILSVSDLAFSGKQYSPVADKTFDVQLKNVVAATITLSGDDAAKFSIDHTALNANGTIIVSIANTDAAGSFSATITVSDNAGDADEQIVTLTLTVESDEAPAWNAEWVEATELYDGMPILITGVNTTTSKIYAMGAQGGNNRAAIEGSLSEGVFTPGAGTKQFTLVVVDAENNKYAIKTTDGKYLYAAGSGSGKNYLRSQPTIDNEATWTLTTTSAVANGTNTNKNMKFNTSSGLFSCYSSGQTAIQLYTPKTYKRTISGNIGTICLPNRVEEGDYFGATFYRVMYKKGDPEAPNYVQLEEVGALEAGRPYIFVPDDRENTSVLRAVYRDKEAVANSAVNDTENHGLYGTFTQVVKDGTNEIIYILNNNTIRRCGTNCTVGANKAYIMMEEVPAENEQPASAPGRRQMSLLNGDARPVATGIEDVQSDVQCTKIFYDGQIYILRGDKMYDVTGKLVK